MNRASRFFRIGKVIGADEAKPVSMLTVASAFESNIRNLLKQHKLDQLLNMLEYNSEILSLLTKRVDSPLLKGYYGGAWGPLNDRFFAITYVPLAGADYFSEFEYYHNKINGYSSFFIDEEKMRLYLDHRSYQHKSKKECIEQGIYKAFMVRFYGMRYEDNWYIQTDLSFIGDLENEVTAKEKIESLYFDDHLWDGPSFKTIRELEPTQIPESNRVRDIELIEFNHMPSLVANIKRDRKTSLKRVFSKYIHELVLLNFAADLRIHLPDKYVELIPLYGEEFALIYPETKKHILFVTLAKNNIHKFRITYFLYVPDTGVFYQWIYPKERITLHSYAYAGEIIEDIKDISGWDDFQYLYSSCTLDNPHFWKNHVFKKENERYRYLEEIKFPSGHLK